MATEALAPAACQAGICSRAAARLDIWPKQFKDRMLVKGGGETFAASAGYRDNTGLFSRNYGKTPRAAQATDSIVPLRIE